MPQDSICKRTKIVATLGPATDKDDVLEKIILAGVNVVRMNFSHGDAQDHIDRAKQVREIAKQHHRTVAIMGDLQGPKIRIARFSNNSVELKVGDDFALDADLDIDAGNAKEVGIAYKSLPQDSSPGDVLLLDDGRIVLDVQSIKGSRIHCKVTGGGTLSNNKGINRQGGGLSADALTKKDFDDITLAAKIDVDYLAVSYVRTADDILQARKLLLQANSDAGLVAKIERSEAVMLDTLTDIINVSDAVMVARGDLGVEIGDAELIAVQKQIITLGQELNTPVITATQMMESMIESSLPTRAEVFDVANAVLDGTDAVMLSAETAAGEFPVEAVEAMCRVILGAERHPQTHTSSHRLHQSFEAIDESIALAAMYVANHLDGVKAIISLTDTGKTPLIMSRISSSLPVYAFTNRTRTENRVALFRGVIPITSDTSTLKPDEMNQSVVDELLRRKVVSLGDLVIITKGDFINAHGGTNSMKIVKVGNSIY